MKKLLFSSALILCFSMPVYGQDAPISDPPETSHNAPAIETAPAPEVTMTEEQRKALQDGLGALKGLISRPDPYENETYESYPAGGCGSQPEWLNI